MIVEIWYHRSRYFTSIKITLIVSEDITTVYNTYFTIVVRTMCNTHDLFSIENNNYFTLVHTDLYKNDLQTVIDTSVNVEKRHR